MIVLGILETKEVWAMSWAKADGVPTSQASWAESIRRADSDIGDGPMLAICYSRFSRSTTPGEPWLGFKKSGFGVASV